MPARTGHSTYIPGRGATTRGKSGKAKTFQGSGPAPSGTKKQPEATYLTAPTLTVQGGHVSASGFRSRAAQRKAVKRQQARSYVRRSQATRKRTSLASAKRLKQTETAVRAAKPIKSVPAVSNEIKAPPAKLAKIKQAIKSNAREFAAEQPARARKKSSFAIPSPKLSPTLQHPKATLRAKTKLTRARRALARTTSRSDGSTEGKVKSALHRRGYNRIGSAGVIGNFKQESGPELNTTADDGSGNGGLAGFTASPVSKADLQAFAASHGLDWKNPKVQVAFVDKHIDPGTKAAVNAAKSPQEAAIAFQDGFERPGIPMQENRERYAVEAFQRNNLAKTNPKATRNYKAAVKKAKTLGISTKSSKVGPAPKRVVTRYKAGRAAMVQLDKLNRKGEQPYVWGGGHGNNPIGGADCSGSVSYALRKMGVLKGSLVSGDMGSVLKPGPGALTVFYNSVHTFIYDAVKGEYWGTSTSNAGGGAGYFSKSEGDAAVASGNSAGAYNVGHVPGLGRKQALQLGSSDVQSFPGMTLASSGTQATINSGAGAMVSTPGFSSKPIQLTPAQKSRRTFQRLKQVGIGVNEPTKPQGTSSTLKALERRYGVKA